MSNISTDWKTLSQKNLVHNRFVDLWEDIVKRPDGKQSTYYVSRRKPFSIIIPLIGNEIVMVRQYRYSIASLSLEFPMGAHIEGTTTQGTAEAELQQETGITAKSWEELGKFWLASGRTNQAGYVYVAKDLTFGTPQPDDGEFIAVERYTIEHIKTLIDTGELLDGPTIIAFHYLEKYLAQHTL